MASDSRIYLSPPHLSGREYARIAEVLDSNWVAPIGPHLEEFERRFAERIGTRHAIAVSSGTAALHLSLRLLDLQPGDEVLCSTFTFCASANPIRYERANPVFIDSDWLSWNLDPQLIEDELRAADRRGRLPRAIMAVDILGQSADLNPILELAGHYEIPVIEDAAEALGATYAGGEAGRLGWTSAFSFNGNKIITTSGGGMLCTNDDRVAAQARHLATQARDPAPWYQHSQIGFNYRMSNVVAAIGIEQLAVLDDRVQRRREVNAIYRRLLADVPGISFMPEADFGRSSCWLSCILVDPDEFGASCEDIRTGLEAHNIESRRTWKPLHMQPVFSGCRVRGGAVSESIFERGLCLPSGTAMSDADVERIVELLRGFASEGVRDQQAA